MENPFQEAERYEFEDLFDNEDIEEEIQPRLRGSNAFERMSSKEQRAVKLKKRYKKIQKKTGLEEPLFRMKDYKDIYGG